MLSKSKSNGKHKQESHEVIESDYLNMQRCTRQLERLNTTCVVCQEPPLLYARSSG